MTNPQKNIAYIYKDNEFIKQNLEINNTKDGKGELDKRKLRQEGKEDNIKKKEEKVKKVKRKVVLNKKTKGQKSKQKITEEEDKQSLLEIQNELDKLKKDIIKDRIETKNFYKSLKLKLPKDGQNTAVHNKTVIS